MTIPTHEEPDDLYEEMRVYEVCVFCRKPTKFWHEKTNNPVCQKCAKTHKVAELHNWRKKSSQKVTPIKDVLENYTIN